MMELIRQPEGSYLCQACCVAMVSGRPLSEVISSCHMLKAPDGSGKYYLTNYESAKFLWQNDIMFGCIGKFSNQKLDVDEGLNFEGVDKIPAIVGVKSKKYVDGDHAVVWCPDRRMILDPQCDEPQPLSVYKVYEWIPCPSMEKDSVV